VRIGIVPSLDPLSGGLHQYTLTILETVTELSHGKSEDEYIIFTRPRDEPFISGLTGNAWRKVPFHPPPFTFRQRVIAFLRASVGQGPLLPISRRLWRRIVRHRIPDVEKAQRRPEFTSWFRRNGVNWVLYSAPNVLSFESGLPYVMPVHDLQHRLQPEFPEVSANGEWERREYLYRNATRYATLILADSEVGKEDILRFYGPYGLSPHRVKVLPLLPANYLSVDVARKERLRVRHTYHLPERYFFYPAQFWPHKNHSRIVAALALLNKERGTEIHLVLCGAHTGDIRQKTFRDAMTLAKQLEVSRQVHYLGRVPDEDVSGLYAEATGLVMPTFFGPTNIPILEAWAFSCPVVSSKIRGVEQQVGDAGLLVPPHSVQAIAGAMHRIWTDEALRKELVHRGHQRLATYGPEDFRQRLADILREANELVREERYPFNVTSTHSQ
jgi:glycosyltransferase involved in cell wall biosynthesis